MENRLKLTRAQGTYLLQEAILFLVVSYLVARGGSAIGLGIFEANLALVAVIGGLWLAWRTVRKRPFPITRLDLPILIFVCVASVASLTSADPRRSAMGLVEVLLAGLVFFFLVDLIRGGLPGELLEKIVLFTSIPLLLFGGLQMFLWYRDWVAIDHWVHLIPPVSQRISAFLGRPNEVAAYLNLLLPLLAVRALRSGSKAKAAGWLGWFLIVEIELFFTSSRGGWLARAVMLGCLGLLLLWEYRKSIRSWWTYLITHPGWLAIIGLFAAVELGLDFSFFGWQTHSTTSAGTGGIDPSARSYIWNVAIDTFRSHPILGNGPFTLSTEFLRTYSVPPTEFFGTAHNLLLNVAAETGMFGLAALLWLAVSLVFLFYKRWVPASRVERIGIAALVAALIGQGAHAMLDTVILVPAIGLILVAYIAILAAGDPVQARSIIHQRLGSGLLIIGCLGLFAGMGFHVLTYRVAFAGAEASMRGDWTTTAARFDQSTQMDPTNAFDWFQAGYAHGILALAEDGSLKDAQNIGSALADYQQGIKIEPVYATNWANLSVLEWANGNRKEALAAMQRAVERANNQPSFSLTLGQMLEEDGQLDQAGQAYENVLRVTPDWGSAYFFRATPYRVQWLEKWQANHPVQPVSQLDSPSEVTELDLQIEGLRALTGQDRLVNQLRLGRYYSQNGEPRKAIQAYQAALNTIDANTSYGVGTFGTSPYGWIVFKQESIAPDLLPGFASGVYTGEVVAGMLDLASNLQLNGETTSAASVYTKILVVAPDNESARSELAKLN